MLDKMGEGVQRMFKHILNENYEAVGGGRHKSLTDYVVSDKLFREKAMDVRVLRVCLTTTFFPRIIMKEIK